SEGAGLLGDGDEGVDTVPEQLGDERLLVGEAPVDGADADAGRPGHLVEGGVEAALGEHLGGGGQDAPPVALGVPAQRALAGSVLRRFACLDRHRYSVPLPEAVPPLRVMLAI